MAKSRKRWAELLLEELKPEEKVLGLTWAEKVLLSEESALTEELTSAEEFFFLEEVTRPKWRIKPVILPRKLVAKLPKPVVVHAYPIFPVILPKPMVTPKAKVMHPVVVALQELTLNVDKSEGYVGDVFTFSGTLVLTAGKKLGHVIYLYRDSVNVGSGTTDAHGDYSIPWTADVIGANTFHTETTI